MRVNTGIFAAAMVLAVAGWGGMAAGQSHDYVFTIDPAQSSLTFQIQVLGAWDTDSSAVSGTMGATLTPANGTFTNIQITNISAYLVNTHLHFDYTLMIFIQGTIDAYNIGLRMGNGFGQAGPAVLVSGGGFNQTGNLVQGIGQIDYNFGTLGIGSVDLASQAPSPADFNGYVEDDGSTVTISIPINLDFLDVGGMGLVNAYVDGQIVATAPTHILTCEEVGEYYPGDINEDCYVDIQDLVLFIQNWLDCNDPDNQNCF